MAWLQVYQWEHDTWPEFQKEKVERHRQRVLIRKLARHFKIDAPGLVYSKQRGANASKSESGASGKYIPSYWNPRIKLGKVTMLGTLCHEFAHHLAFRRWKANQGHNKKFKRELKRVYTWARRYLPQTQAVEMPVEAAASL